MLTQGFNRENGMNNHQMMITAGSELVFYQKKQVWVQSFHADCRCSSSQSKPGCSGPVKPISLPFEAVLPLHFFSPVLPSRRSNSAFQSLTLLLFLGWKSYANIKAHSNLLHVLAKLRL